MPSARAVELLQALDRVTAMEDPHPEVPEYGPPKGDHGWVWRYRGMVAIVRSGVEEAEPAVADPLRALVDELNPGPAHASLRGVRAFRVFPGCQLSVAQTLDPDEDEKEFYRFSHRTVTAAVGACAGGIHKVTGEDTTVYFLWGEW